MPTMNTTKALKTFFERDDKIAPGGGRKITLEDLMGGFDKEGRQTEEYERWKTERSELAKLAATELGVELENA